MGEHQVCVVPFVEPEGGFVSSKTFRRDLVRRGNSSCTLPISLS